MIKLSLTWPLLDNNDFISRPKENVLWRFDQSPEGVLEFPHSPLLESAYLPEIIKFTFPMEIMTFSPPPLITVGQHSSSLIITKEGWHSVTQWGTPQSKTPHQIRPGYSIREASLIEIMSFRKVSSSMRIYKTSSPS